MNLTRRLKITVTRRRVLRPAGIVVRAFCPVCAHEVETLARVQAAEVLEVDGEMLASLIAAGRVHALALVSGSQRVCRDSLWA
ncbi:MAG: hypothetical protein HYR56_02955 [Acidobacteria bacterium]|nr:hypothetical protein [Acidobacteriota bacterium]MBI3423582.1 hypothetical protein [Acidobacteriota bacterium]